MRIIADYDNLNRTADFLVQKNSVLRNRNDNPIQFVLKQMLESIETQVTQHSLEQLANDSSQGVHYLVDGQSQVSFWLEITDSEGRLVNAPAARFLNDPYSNENKFWVKNLPAAVEGHTVVAHFYARLGNQPSNLTSEDLLTDD